MSISWRSYILKYLLKYSIFIFKYIKLRIVGFHVNQNDKISLLVILEENILTFIEMA